MYRSRSRDAALDQRPHCAVHGLCERRQHLPHLVFAYSAAHTQSLFVSVWCGAGCMRSVPVAVQVEAPKRDCGVCVTNTAMRTMCDFFLFDVMTYSRQARPMTRGRTS